MSKINFLTGELNGKLGSIVGSTRKGTYYTKSYSKPKNPNTPLQQETRYLFKSIAHIGSRLKDPLAQYTRPKPHKMTAYNHLLKLNKPMFEKQGQKWNPLELIIMAGELKSAAITSATFDSTAFSAVVTWNTVGKATDKAFIVVYDDESKRIVYVDDIDRSAGTVTLDASVFADVSSYGEIYAYLAFYTIAADGSGMNSETTVLKATKV